MAKVHWPTQTLSEIAEIAAYIERYNPAAALKMQKKLIALGESLSHSPRKGRPMPNGTRQLVTVRPYVLRYIIEGRMS